MLKNILLKTTLSAALLVGAGAAQAANTYDIAENGGFETGDSSGWTVFEIGGTSSSLVSTVNPKTGVYSGQATCGFGPCDVLYKNANKGIGEAVGGGSITINFDYRGTAINGGVIFVEVFSELDGGGTSKSEIIPAGGPIFPFGPDSDFWLPFSHTTTLGLDVSGGVTVQLKASCGAVVGCVSDIFFDNLEMLIEPPAAIPVPAAAWLFGSALLGLGGIARKKRSA